MKKIVLLILMSLALTGCFEGTNFSDNKTYVTIYPIEYIADYLYSDYSEIKSIYPNGINIEEYSLTEKQKNNYSKGNKFIYNGISDEVDLAVDFLNKNKNLEIIDTMKNMNYKYGLEELWLDPSHYLMMARNVKESLIDYENNVYTKEKIEENYKELKIAISEIDVDLTMIGKNASYHNIIVANEVLSFLSKYNINVVSLDTENSNYEKNYKTALTLASDEDISYLYKLKGYELTDSLNSLVNTYDLEVIEIDDMVNLTEEQRKNSETYITIMNDNIDKLKRELLK